MILIQTGASKGLQGRKRR